MTSGTYFVRAGDSFYIGSSGNFRRRRYSHLGNLKHGCHQNDALQAAFDACGEAAFIPFRFIKRELDESDESFRDRLRAAEQLLLDTHWDSPGRCNRSPSAYGPDNGEVVRKMWDRPGFREMMSKIAREKVVTPETRVRMSQAKRGSKNPNAREVLVSCPDGSKRFFPTGVAAAEFFGVTQQLFDQWMKGVTAWPGTGKRGPREANRWIVGYSAEYYEI